MITTSGAQNAGNGSGYAATASRATRIWSQGGTHAGPTAAVCSAASTALQGFRVAHRAAGAALLGMRRRSMAQPPHFHTRRTRRLCCRDRRAAFRHAGVLRRAAAVGRGSRPQPRRGSNASPADPPGSRARAALPGPAATRPRPLAVPPPPALSACAQPGCFPPLCGGPARPGQVRPTSALPIRPGPGCR